MDKSQMSRTNRIRTEYSRPDSRAINGQSTERNIRLMSARASENSKLAPRAKGGEIELPDTFRRQPAEKPHTVADPRAVAKAELNHSTKGTDYMPGIRRNAA
jgi:hypothetical protein